MPSYLFKSHFIILLFVVVVLCSTSYVTVYATSVVEAETDEQGKLSGDLFVVGTPIDNVKGPTGDSTPPTKTITLCQIRSHFFLFAAKGGVMVAITEAEYTEKTSSHEKKVDVVAKFIQTNNLKNEDIKGTAGSWKTQLVTENYRKNAVSATGIFVLYADENKINVFLVNIKDSSQEWEFKHVEGTFNGEQSDTLITRTTNDLNGLDVGDPLKKTLQEYKIKLFVDDGSAFLIKDKKFLFVVKGESDKANEEKKNVVVVLQFKEARKELTVVQHENNKNGYPTFFKWGDEIFMIPTDDSEKNKGKLVMFNAAEEPKFIVTDNPIVRLKSFLKDKKSFLTATIESKGAVLLFTQQKKVDSKKENVNLWMSDGTRVSCAGTIVENLSSTDKLYASLLYTDKKLFALHQTVKATGVGEDNNKVQFTLLKEQLKNITNTLTAWKESNIKVKELYTDTATPITDINFTDGIVGFLSGNEKNDWEDGFLYAKATVTPAGNGKTITKKENGFTFAGTGAGAKWPVSKAADDQPYNFIDPGFTLLATVTVGSGGTNGSENSILGVGLASDTKISLWCTANGKWGVKKSGQEEITASEINCTRDERYYVALTLDNSKKVFIYVDGQQLPKSEGIDVTQSTNIDYFYFGADSGPQSANTDVTITNVLLYNRPCDGNKIQQLKPKKEKKVESQQRPEDVASKLPKPDGNRTEAETESPSSTSAKQTATEKDGAETNLCLFLMNNVIVLFLLFGVFTL